MNITKAQILESKLYLTNRIRKRKPLLEELLGEDRIGFECQRRNLGELQEVGVERRRIDHDLHARRHSILSLSLIQELPNQGKLYGESAIGRRGDWIWRFKCGLGRNPRSPWELEDRWLEREKIRESFFFFFFFFVRERERDGIGRSDKWKWERKMRKIGKILFKWKPEFVRNWLNNNSHVAMCCGRRAVGKTRSPITCTVFLFFLFLLLNWKGTCSYNLKVQWFQASSS